MTTGGAVQKRGRGGLCYSAVDTGFVRHRSDWQYVTIEMSRLIGIL